ncbi:MAG: hypothetical protein FGM15_11680 [Chthoniobacterales bacterium]|nr:hypothetical protein [Chthoniobacterales bacterium]
MSTAPMNTTSPKDSTGTIVAAYYFPNYHIDPANEREHGPGWTEWQIMKAAHPRFDGHYQPRVPAWGYEDESDPAVMEKKISAAADHGVNCFIFDWYHYQDGPFLEGCLERGYFGAANNDRVKFCCMWANHDWVDLFPAKYSKNPYEHARLLQPGAVDDRAFDAIIERLVGRYFVHPSHQLIEGCPFFSVYDLGRLVAGFGSVEKTRAALERFREATKKAGFPDLHLNAIVWGTPILPGETTPVENSRLVNDLGFDSATSYVYVHHTTFEQFPAVSYRSIRDGYLRYWAEDTAALGIPYIPNVTVGWDASPRTTQSDIFANRSYPFISVIGDSSPQEFETALRMTRERMQARTGRQIPMVTINSWNEWSEGSYLEPDMRHGLGYLEAVRAVFGA